MEATEEDTPTANTTIPNSATIFDDSPEINAYAKLEFEHFSFYVQTLTLVVGRKARPDDSVDVHLGVSKSISRNHAKIYYQFGATSWEIAVMGKNGAFVNDRYVEGGQIAELKHLDKLQIADVAFTFLLPDGIAPPDEDWPISGTNNNADHEQDMFAMDEELDSYVNREAMGDMNAKFDPMTISTPIKKTLNLQVSTPKQEPFALQLPASNQGTPELRAAQITGSAPATRPIMAQKQPAYAHQIQDPGANSASQDAGRPTAVQNSAAPINGSQMGNQALSSQTNSGMSVTSFNTSQKTNDNSSDIQPMQQNQAQSMHYQIAQNDEMNGMGLQHHNSQQFNYHNPYTTEEEDPAVIAGYSKPPLSYATLIYNAVNSCPQKKLTLAQIYDWICSNHPYYKYCQNGWQNSIRHNLSLNKAFKKVARTDNEPGKGAFWAIEPTSEKLFEGGIYKKKPPRPLPLPTTPNVAQPLRSNGNPIIMKDDKLALNPHFFVGSIAGKAEEAVKMLQAAIRRQLGPNTTPEKAQAIANALAIALANQMKAAAPKPQPPAPMMQGGLQRPMLNNMQNRQMVNGQTLHQQNHQGQYHHVQNTQSRPVVQGPLTQQQTIIQQQLIAQRQAAAAQYHNSQIRRHDGSSGSINPTRATNGVHATNSIPGQQLPGHINSPVLPLTGSHSQVSQSPAVPATRVPAPPPKVNMNAPRLSALQHMQQMRANSPKALSRPQSPIGHQSLPQKRSADATPLQGSAKAVRVEEASTAANASNTPTPEPTSDGAVAVAVPAEECLKSEVKSEI